MTKFQHYQSVCKWKCKLRNLLKDFTSCVIFLSVCKPEVTNILTFTLITAVSHHTATSNLLSLPSLKCGPEHANIMVQSYAISQFTEDEYIKKM